MASDRQVKTKFTEADIKLFTKEQENTNMKVNSGPCKFTEANIKFLTKEQENTNMKKET